MIDYIWRSFTAWFMGFFPLFEVYLAIPAAIGMGLDTISAVGWSVLGNFMVIPFVSYFYDYLVRSKRVCNYFSKLAHSKTSTKLRRGGIPIVLLSTPILGSWGVAVVAKLIGMDRKKLFITSAASIIIYGIVIGYLTHIGLSIAF